jgi:hypothetical protein
MTKDPIQKKILTIVLCLHGAFLLLAILSPKAVTQKKPQKPLVVKTITPSAAPQEKMIQARAPSAPVSKIAKVEKKEEAAAAKPTPPPAQKPTPKKAPPIADKKLVKEKEKKNTPVKQAQEEKRERMSQKLLQELEESLNRLETKPEKKKGSGKKQDFSKAIDPLNFGSGFGSEASDSGDYSGSLVGYLKQVLNLPEYGDVKIQLTVKEDGSFVNLVVLKAESEKNRKYLETSLPHLSFPPLKGKKKQETFTVTFCNEI